MVFHQKIFFWWYHLAVLTAVSPSLSLSLLLSVWYIVQFVWCTYMVYISRIKQGLWCCLVSINSVQPQQVELRVALQNTHDADSIFRESQANSSPPCTPRHRKWLHQDAHAEMSVMKLWNISWMRSWKMVVADDCGPPPHKWGNMETDWWVNQINDKWIN